MNNFTPRAQQALSLAGKEANQLHHHYIGTEHLLLGILVLGQGVAINEAEQQIGQVVEGKYNASQVCFLAQNHQVEMPICEHINALLTNKMNAQQVVQELMSRPAKDE
jgi:glycerol-3-phosphate dehydrogenase